MQRYLSILLLLTFSCIANAQESPSTESPPASASIVDDKVDQKVEVADEVQVEPVNSDERIQTRLQDILDATGWFDSPQVRVDRGVAFISGIADSQKHLEWAESTAMKTSDVVAIVNRIDVADQPFWNFATALASIKQLGRETAGILPLVVVAIVDVCTLPILMRVNLETEGRACDSYASLLRIRS